MGVVNSREDRVFIQSRITKQYLEQYRETVSYTHLDVYKRQKEANAGRQHDAPGRRLDGTSHFFSELQVNPSLAIDLIIAPPRMAYYMEYSTRTVSYTHLDVYKRQALHRTELIASLTTS